jgi:O-antigen/teichoic acid export membrane protein
MSHSSQFATGNIFSRLLKGMGANFIGVLLNFVSKILLTPLFLQAWGVNIYGEWLLLSSFVAYLSLTDMGGQLYIINRLTQAYAKNDIPLFRQILHTGLALFLVMPMTVFLLFVVTILCFPVLSFLRISEAEQHVAILVLAILSFQFIISLPQGILLGIYRAVGMLPRGVMLGNLLLLLQLVLVSGGLWLGSRMVGIAILQIIPFFLIAAFAIHELNRNFPQFQLLSLKTAKLSIAKTFIKPSLHFFSIQLAQMFSIQGTVLIVGMMLNPVQVVVFSTIRTMVNVMKQMLSIITHSAWPEMTRLDAEQHINQLYIFFRAILRSTMLIALVFIAIFYFFGEAIYYLWLGNTVKYQHTVMYLFLIYLFQLIFWTSCSHVLMATNNHHTLAKFLLVTSLLSLVLAYIGGLYFGLEGIITGIILADLLLPFWMVPYLLRKYHPQFSLIFYLKEITPPIIAIISFIFFPELVAIVFLLFFVWWVQCLPKDRLSSLKIG